MKNIVLIDFTPESDNSLKYAIEITKPIKGAHLELINVSKASNFTESNKKLQALKEKHNSDELKIEAVELTGDFMEVLPEYINSEKTGFVFCGTHDIRFLEHLFNSRALKLMQSSHANFIFIPNTKKSTDSPKHVMVPILEDNDSLQSLEPLLFLKHFLKFEITLVTYKGQDTGQKGNLIVATKILDKKDVDYKIEYLGESQTELLDGIENLATSLNVEMISIVDFTEDSVFNFGAVGFVEGLIRNENNLGVMVIQNQDLEYYTGFKTQGG